MNQPQTLHYLDNASTTRVAPEVAEVIFDALNRHWANPSSLYEAGKDAEDVITAARGVLAKAMGLPPDPMGTNPLVFFTASGTEADNIAIFGAARRKKQSGLDHIVATGYEHPGCAEALAALEKEEGFRLTAIAPDSTGAVDAEKLVDAVTPQTGLVCAMQVNNETGAVLDVAALARRVKEKNSRAHVHVDGVQGFCKLPLDLKTTPIDSYAVSAHKLHGPKGIGALYLRQRQNISPPLRGGGQEKGLRPGTENTACIAGFAKAVEMALALQKSQAALPEAGQTIPMLHEQLLAGLAGLGATLHSPPGAWPGIVMFSMPADKSGRFLKSQPMIDHLYRKFGVCVSGGSACSGGAPSHTLSAMGLPGAQIGAALRVSFCPQNTADDVAALLAGLEDCAKNLARA